MDASVIAAFVAAAAAISVALINAWSNRKNCKAVDMAALKDSLDQHIMQDDIRAESFESKMRTLQKHSEENYKARLRETFNDKSLPLKERAEAAGKYIDCGYNGRRKVEAQAVMRAYEATLEQEVNGSG